MRKRVVITGIGIVAPNGIGKQTFWDALVEGKSAIREISQFDASSYPCRIAGEVYDFDPVDFMSVKTVRRTCRFIHMGVAAAHLAITDGSLAQGRLESRRTGVFMGNSFGGLDALEEQFAIFHEKGFNRLSPFTTGMLSPHAAASQIAIDLRIRGPSVTVATSCPAGISAIQVAMEGIVKGSIDVALVGGSEAPITPGTVAAFAATRTLAKQNHDPSTACKPFDLNRSGFVLSEGAAVVVLEELGHAQSRSAPLYGEVLGCSVTNDAYSTFDIDPSGDGLYRAMRNALEESRLSTREVDYISAHAASMVLTDKVESLAIKRLLGKRAQKVPVSSIKSMIGQPLAATGILQVAACLLAFQDHVIPPTINYEHPDPECDLDCVPNKARKKTIETALINTHGYGGINAALVVRKIR
jgi:3-oxoacyl-[acyl-carrier-protein] synthase II